MTPTSRTLTLRDAFDQLAAWCRARDYAGYDPFDALNSRIFQALPFARRSRVARLIWTQASKRSPVNLRRLALVPAERNTKGTALFALGWLSRWRGAGIEEMKREARNLLDDLLAARLVSRRGAVGWGYNFDWQGRAFFAPRGTPTVVPTAFAIRALAEGWLAFGDEHYLSAARGACDFILNDLQRSEESTDEVCFSYTPLDHTRVFNASLLAAEALATMGALTGETSLLREARRAARYVVRRQRADGSWAYGADSYQSWADNFHTAFVLTSLARIIDAGGDEAGHLNSALRRGYDFWRKNFFLAGGWPKYYHDRAYPADAHSAAAAIVGLCELRNIDAGALPLAEEIADWSLRNLRDPAGYFYYQRRRTHTVRTPYMRWAQSWMLYALARLLETINEQ